MRNFNLEQMPSSGFQHPYGCRPYKLQVTGHLIDEEDARFYRDIFNLSAMGVLSTPVSLKIGPIIVSNIVQMMSFQQRQSFTSFDIVAELLIRDQNVMPLNLPVINFLERHNNERATDVQRGLSVEGQQSGTSPSGQAEVATSAKGMGS